MRWTIILIGLLLFSCAQVGSLKGGQRDTIAPIPDEENMSPKNGSRNFTGNKIEIPFKEFVVLNKPTENLIVVPPSLKPSISLKARTVTISWEDTLLENTTYAFYMNGLVQDLSEKNDSLMTFVFSTGDQLDSLTATVKVIDAFDSRPLKDIVVGLYLKYVDTIRPLYFAQTGKLGFAELKYLKPGEYELFAFKDDNKDLLAQKNEKVAFRSTSLIISPAFTDTSKLRMFLPEVKKEIRSLKFNAPGRLTIGSTASLENAEIKVNGKLVESDKIYSFAKDSIAVPVDASDTNALNIVVNSLDWTDTSKVRVTTRDKQRAWTIVPLFKNKQFQKDEITFLSSSIITDVDTTKLLVRGIDDSLWLRPNFIINGLQLSIGKEGLNLTKGLEIQILPGGVLCDTLFNIDTLKHSVQFYQQNELGNLVVQIGGFDSTLLLEVLLGAKVVKTTKINETGKLEFTNMEPGEYRFRAILDANENGKWDVGNRLTKVQPEEVYNFPKSYKLRANWDLDVELLKAKEDETEQK